MFFREAVKAITKTKVFSLIIIIQLSISFLTLIGGVYLVQGTLSQLYKFNNIFDEKCTINITNQNILPFEHKNNDNSHGELLQYYEELLKDKNIVKMGTCWSGGAGTLKLSDLNIVTNGKLMGTSNSIFIDKNFFKYIRNINISSGRNFTEEDFNKNEGDLIPIIISKDLKNVMPLNSVIMGKLKIIGILKNNNNLFFDDTGNLYTGVTQKQKTIIVPINYNNLSNQAAMAQGIVQNTLITLKDFSLAEEYITKIKNDMVNITPTPFEVHKVSDIKAEYIDLIKTPIAISLSFATILIIFSFLGIMSIILTSLIRRKKEFGIKLSIGWTFKNICYQVIIEIFLLGISSYIIALMLSLILIQDDIYELNLATYLPTLVVVIVLMMFYSIMPIIKIRKMNIVDLIKDVR
ncbi:MAG: ABC transporter permease [Clostridiaceae bacterium]|nr:ABC transporter permease [Clostridiaceae bacterium]